MVKKEKVEKLVKDWFAKTADYEWKRLKQDAYHQLEFIVTNHFLKKYLPKKGLVLDAGGGPGRYTIELAKKGYNIVLLDLVKEMLEIAKKQIKRERIQHNVKRMIEGSVTDLSTFIDETFDAVLCLGGPLSHLLDSEQRETAARELVRVAKKNAPLFVSVIGRFGLLKTILKEFPEEMKYSSHHLEVGDYIPGVQGKGFTAAHWFTPEELQRLLEKQNVETLDLVALEGLSSHLEEATNRLYEDKEKWNMWLDIVIRTCNQPSIVGTAEHILYVGRKRK
ncbi:class I SAM-dependent methyltransferase [Candidatus Bathyarchaeota archaeon]|nr:MAG: class I SAM-dependent methyltransferase [Candidatus Bathyarchaeota archaeon]